MSAARGSWLSTRVLALRPSGASTDATQCVVGTDAEYGFGHFREWEPFIGANYLFNGSERIDFQQDTSYSRIRLPAYQMFGLQLGARNETWTVEFFAKNIADKRAFNSAAALSGDPQGPYALGVIHPRTLGLSVIAKY